MSNKQNMKTTKITTGIYKVEIGNSTLVIRDQKQQAMSSTNVWEVYNASSRDELTSENCWACGAKSKKQALEFIQEDFDKGFLN